MSDTKTEGGFVRRSPLDRLAGYHPALLLTVACSVFVALSLMAMEGESSTLDEGAHLVAGYTYLKKCDFWMNPEHPPLVKLLAALPLLFQEVRWPTDPALWKGANQWAFSHSLLYQSGNDPDRLLFWGRLATLPWGLAFLIAVYTVAKSLFGPRGGLISLVLATFSPTLLAHGHLVTTDVAVTSLFFVTVVAFWKLFQKMTYFRSACCGLLLGAALGAKFSGLLLLPILGLLAILRFFDKRNIPGPSKNPSSRLWRHPPWLRTTLSLSLVVLISYLTLWGIYGFRYAASPDESFTFIANKHFVQEGLTGRVVDFARAHRLLPEAYLAGFLHVKGGFSQGRSAYALGLHSSTGWWWYFPFAFLVKTPFPTLILMAWGFYAWYRGARLRGQYLAFLIVPMVLYWSFAIGSGINIGIRHLLPAYPFLMVLAGGIDLSSGSSCRVLWKMRAISTLLVGTIASCILSTPFFLAYFNVPSRLLFERHYMLAHSNLDWGQDLKRLKRYMDQNGIREVKLSYFGSASPAHLDLEHQLLAGFNLYQRYERGWTRATQFAPGEYVAISASNLVSVYLRNRIPELTRLDEMEPVARIGHSILLYRLPDDWHE